MVKNRRITMQKKWYGSVRSIFMHADRTDLILMIIGFIGAVGDGFSIPVVLYVSSKLMNSVGAMSASTSQSINTNTLVLLYVACGQWLACFLEGYCWTRTAGRQASRLRIRYLKAVLRQDVGYFDLHRTSTMDVITSVSSDSLVIQDVIAEKVPNLLMNAATFVAAYIVAFLMFWRLAIVGVPFILLLVVPGMMSGRALMGIARRMKDEYSNASTIAEQALSSIRTVYSFVGEKRMVDEFSAALRGSVNLGIRQGLIKGLATSKNAVVFAKWSFMSCYATRVVINHGAQGGTIFQVICVMAGGGFALGAGISNLRYFSEAFAAGERIVEVMERVPHIDSDNMEGQILQNMYGEIEFEHVEFFYPSRPGNIILKNFNLKIPASKNVALVGGSGSGKSTVIALLQRFYNSTGGEILLDGVALYKLQLKWLRSQMGLVSQEPALFATTIKENILFGKENASMEEVFKAAKASNAHNFICELPQGYDTQVGERGVQMSGGQKQRIAIARAIIKAPRILLLDEATSALDSESERIVQEAIDKVTIGCTTITIAHRLSTIRKAHVINVLQDGKVVETGSHDELVQYENGLYTSLIRLQQMKRQEYAYSSTASNQNLDPTSSNEVSNMSDLGLTSRSVPLIPSNSFDVSFLSSFQRLLALNLPEWKHATFACIGAILFGAVQPVYAFIVGSTISIYFLTNQDEIKTNIKAYSLGFLGLSIFALLANICQQYWFAVTGERLAQRIRENMLSKILTFEIGWFDQEDNASGSICSRITNDSSSIRSLVGDRFSLVVHAISAVIFASAMGLIIAWRLALVMIAVQPLIIFSVYARVVLLKKMSNKVIKAQNGSSRIAAEAMSNFRTVTAFFSQGRILKSLEKSQEGPNQEIIQQSWFTGLGYGTAHCLITCIWGFELWYGGKLITENQIGVRAFFMTFFALWSTGLVVAEAGSMTTDLTRGFDAVRSILLVLDRCSEIDPQESNGYRPDKIVGHLELCEVDFAYPARPNLMIFECFSINIEAGKAMALIGESGSGKSTIINLIERFYDPLKGVVKLDGRDIKTYHLRSLRKFIALVSQEPTLFSGTIRDNIMYGISDNTNEMEIIKAAEAANAHDFITGLKDGYNTWCGDRGSQLSGGQKQRIAIARAILKAPAVLLLDEATSALDSQAEALVQEALERMMVGRTSVVVTHRLSTIKNCNTISVLDKGKVVEEGTHTSLLAKGPTGIYYSLVSQNLQTPTAAFSS